MEKTANPQTIINPQQVIDPRREKMKSRVAWGIAIYRYYNDRSYVFKD